MLDPKNHNWLPTPTFLYRNYLYLKIAKSLPKGLHFLDVGAGNGKFLMSVWAMGFKGESIDASKQAVAFARSEVDKSQKDRIKLGNILTYKPKEKYDVVFCFEVLEHIKDDKGAVEKIFQLLKPGGLFVMSVPAHMSEWSTIDDKKGHFRRYERAELSGMLNKVGFETESVFTYGFPFLSLLRRFSRSGKSLQSKTQHLSKELRGRESSIQQEYSPRLKFLAGNKALLFILFKIMDLFIRTDLGFGYIVVAERPKTSP